MLFEGRGTYVVTFDLRQSNGPYFAEEKKSRNDYIPELAPRSKTANQVLTQENDVPSDSALWKVLIDNDHLTVQS